MKTILCTTAAAVVMALAPASGAGAATLPAPDPVTPSVAATLDQPVFSWAAVPGADHYEFQAALDDQFVTVTDPELPSDPEEVPKTRPVYGTVYVPTFTYSAKTHYWRVRAVTSSGTPGDWSSPRAFTRRWTLPAEASGTEGAGPAARVENVRLRGGGTSPQLNDVAIQWDPVPGAAAYQVQIGGPRSSLLCTTPHTTLVPPFDGKYMRREPLSGCAPLSPLRTWAESAGWNSPGPGEIAVQASEVVPGDLLLVRFLTKGGDAVLVPPFLTTVTSVGGDPREFTAAGTAPGSPDAMAQYLVVDFPVEQGATYTVRVRAVDATVDPDYPFVEKAPVYGPWSDQRREPLDPPGPMFDFTPQEAAAGGGSLALPATPLHLTLHGPDVPELEWAPVAGAVAYEVTIALDRDFTNKVATYRTRNTVMVPPETFDDNGPAGTYHWFVTPCTYAGVEEGTVVCGVPDRVAINDPQYVGRFTKNSAPMTGTSHTPVDSGRNVLLRWGDALAAAQAVQSGGTPGGVARYHLQVTTGTWLEATSVLTDNLAFSTAAMPNLRPGTYRWRVRPWDGQNVPLAFSTGPDFTIAGGGAPDTGGSTPPTGGTTTPPGPDEGTTAGGSQAPTPVYQAPVPTGGTAREVPPAAPGKPRLKQVKKALRVRWRASEELGEAVRGYLLYRSTDGTSFSVVKRTAGTSTKVKAAARRTYWFYVVADSQAGRSDRSPVAKVRMRQSR